MIERFERSSGRGSRYLRGLQRCPRLSPEDERSLALRIQAGHEPSYHDLVQSNLGFVAKVAVAYRNYGLPFEDLLSEGNLGLLEAARRFDPERGTRFTTCAVFWVRRAILRALSRQIGPVFVPEQKRRQMRAVLSARARLSQDLGREAARWEVSESLSMSPSRIDAILERRVAQTSLNDPIGGGETSLLDVLVDARASDPETHAIRHESGRTVGTALGRLEPREREVLRARFGLEGGEIQSLGAIGRRLRLSREAVRLIEKRALRKARHLLARSGIHPGRPGRAASSRASRSVTASPTASGPSSIT
jgi:RNA polymerase primary sigma factor